MIFNERLTGEHLYNTNEFRLPYCYKTAEVICMIKYMLSLKLGTKDMKQKIEEVMETPLSKQEFLYMVGNASRYRAMNDFRVELKQGTIDYINSMRAPMWQKQFALLVILYVTVEPGHYYYKVMQPLKHLVKRTNRHEDQYWYKVIERLVNDNVVFIDDCDRMWMANEDRIYDTVVDTADDIVDACKWFSSIKYTTKCEICGYTFEHGCKCKRTICDNCYAEMARKRATKAQFERRKAIRESCNI